MLAEAVVTYVHYLGVMVLFAASLSSAAIIDLPAGIRIIQRIELVAIVLLPLLAVLMARA